MIDYQLKTESLNEETSQNARAHDELMREINYGLEEGLIEVEFIDGVPHLFPANEGV